MNRWGLIGMAAAVSAGLGDLGSPFGAERTIQIGCTGTTDCASAADWRSRTGSSSQARSRRRADFDRAQLQHPRRPDVGLAADRWADPFGVPPGGGWRARSRGGLGSVVDREGDGRHRGGGGQSRRDHQDGQGLRGQEGRRAGIGAFLDVLFRKWLIQSGVDPKAVSFVEVTFPTMNDVLKSGAVDAVVTAEPVLSRIVKAGTGTVAANYLAELPPHEPQILYAATRGWAEANPKAVEAFRASIREAAEIVNRDPDKGRAAISPHFTKMPLDVLKTMKVSVSDPVSSRPSARMVGGRDEEAGHAAGHARTQRRSSSFHDRSRPGVVVRRAPSSRSPRFAGRDAERARRAPDRTRHPVRALAAGPRASPSRRSRGTTRIGTTPAARRPVAARHAWPHHGHRPARLPGRPCQPRRPRGHHAGPHPGRERGVAGSRWRGRRRRLGGRHRGGASSPAPLPRAVAPDTMAEGIGGVRQACTRPSTAHFSPAADRNG